jgi:hypothetical protein
MLYLVDIRESWCVVPIKEGGVRIGGGTKIIRTMDIIRCSFYVTRISITNICHLALGAFRPIASWYVCNSEITFLAVIVMSSHTKSKKYFEKKSMFANR